jgi:heat shock protein HtpX
MAGESSSFWQLERVNRRRTLALVVKLILWLAAFGLALDFLFHNLRFSDGRLSGIPWITEAALLLAVVQALRANFGGADLVLGALDAHPISSDDPKNQAVIDVVHEMALAARIPTPRIDLIDDPSPNAFAIGRDPEHSAICVTQGLLDQMDREELQGVIGHEMAHIRDYDTQLTTMVTAMVGGFGVFRFIFGVPTIWKASGGGGILARIISRMLSREREYLADAAAVELTRNPTALIRALEQIAKTESPLRCATHGTAQLFIVDPFEVAGGATSYKEYINEITRIRLQPGKTQEQRDQEAGKFAINEYPRNMLAERISSHPPLGERIERLQALIHAAPGAAAASGVTDDQLRAKFTESALFVRNLASTDPDFIAKVMQAAVLVNAGYATRVWAPALPEALPGGGGLFQEMTEGTQIHRESTTRDPLAQKLREANLASAYDLLLSRNPVAQKLFESVLASTGALKSNEGGDLSLSPPSAADPVSGKGIDPADPAAGQEVLQREALAKMMGPIMASMRPKYTAPRPAAAERPGGSMAAYLFWFVIAFSAVAIIASFAIR